MAVSAIRELRPIHVFEMMERLGIEPSSSVAPRSTLTYATAVHRCEVCPYHENCRYWLDHAPASSVLLRISVQTQTSYLNCSSIKSDRVPQRLPSRLRSVESFKGRLLSTAA